MKTEHRDVQKNVLKKARKKIEQQNTALRKIYEGIKSKNIHTDLKKDEENK